MNHNSNTSDNQLLLARCKNAVEQKLAWGSSVNWQTQDYERLSDRIFEDTNVRLSASTLKRIWGKVQYTSTPNLSTLDALAAFAGHTDWRSFAGTQEQPIPERTIPVKSVSFRMMIPLLIAVGSCLLIGFALTRRSSKKLAYQNIRFSSQPVTVGLPNTVVFEYDASDSNADSVFIQQSWDERKRFKVNKNQHTYTSTYYLPGYYRAKLILDDSVVKEHDLLIESAGWTGAILGQQAPVYLSDSMLKQKEGFGITMEKLAQLNIDTRETPAFILSNVSRKNTQNGDNFLLDLQLQNTYSYPNAVCRKTEILIHGTKGVIIIPICSKGCVGEIRLLIGSESISGETNDLSGFGVDFSSPVQVRCEVKEKRIRIAVNDHSVFDAAFNEDIGSIVGTRFRFEGTGQIKNMQLTSASE